MKTVIAAIEGMQLPGKMIVPVEIDRPFVLFKNLIPDGNNLEHHYAVFPKQPAADAKKGIEVVMADRLDHLN